MDNLTVKRTDIFPMIALRGLIVFPDMFVHFDIMREKSVAALEQAMLLDQMIFLVSQKDASVNEPTFSDLQTTGVIAKVKQVVKLPGGVVRILVEGLKRAKLVEITNDDKYLEAMVSEMELIDEDFSKSEEEALVRRIRCDFKKYASRNKKINSETVFSLNEIKDLSRLTDNVISNLPVDLDVKQEFLDNFDPKDIAFVY